MKTKNFGENYFQFILLYRSEFIQLRFLTKLYSANHIEKAL